MEKEITIYRSRNGCIVIRGTGPLTSTTVQTIHTFDTATKAIPLLKLLLKEWDGWTPTLEEKEAYKL